MLALLLVFMLALGLSQAAYAEPELVIPDLTIEDLKAMNGGDLRYTTNDEGYVTFLYGKFYDGVIKSEDDLTRALGGIALLLGADESTAFLQSDCLEDDNGYLYYTYCQWLDNVQVESAIVKIITDPQGNTVALSSSIAHGVPGKQEDFITQEDAVKIVRQTLEETEPDVEHIYYEDNVDRTLIQFVSDYGITLNLVYVVYTDNPSATVEGNDLFYLAHYVRATGEYLYAIPVSKMGDSYALEGSDTRRVFEGKTQTNYTGTVTYSNGETREVSVPVMLDEETGTYYLADISREMAVADYWEFSYNNYNAAIMESKTNDDWPDSALIGYSNYIQAYDYYNDVGWPSCDGLGTPILLLNNFVDADHNPVNNACYMGSNFFGWQAFAMTSEANNFNEAMDIIGHEYTHGVTTAAMTSMIYQNQYGAINESMSDIMGNIMEMMTGSTDDTTWLMGETTGTPVRCMSDPNRFMQPAYVGDLYYVPDAQTLSSANDRGGVHLNNSLLCGVAPKLYNAGMTLEEERNLWSSFICALTPKSAYKDACLILPFAAEVCGLTEYQDEIAKVLDEIGFENPDPFGTLEADSSIVTMDAPEGIDEGAVQLALLYDDVNERGIRTYPAGGTGKITLKVKPGTYKLRFRVYDLTSDTLQTEYFYDGEKWTLDEAAKEIEVELPAGERVPLPCDGIEPSVSESTEEPSNEVDEQAKTDAMNRFAEELMGSYSLSDMASPAEAEAARALMEVASMEETEVPSYTMFSTIKEPQKVVFFNGNTSVPYMELDEMFGMLKMMRFQDQGYSLDTFYGDHFYVATRETGEYAFIDFNSGIVVFSDYDMFGRSASAVSGGDILNSNTSQFNEDGSVKTDENGVPLVNLFKRQDTQRNFTRHGYSLAAPIALGGIPIYWVDGKGYLPVTTFADLFLSTTGYSWIYNGQALFLTFKNGFDANVQNDEGKTLKDIAFDVPSGDRTKELAEYTYNEMVMMLEGNYGLRDEHGIGKDFDQYLASIGLKDRMLKPSGAEFCDALGELMTGYFGDLHSSMSQGSPFAGADYAFDIYTHGNVSLSFANTIDSMRRYYVARGASGCVDAQGVVIPYQEIGDTAYITFDSFLMNMTQNYYDPAVQETLSDTIGSDNVALIHYANERINRENSPIRNVVIDLSNNSGGMADAAYFVSSWVLGTCNFSTVNPRSQAQYTVGYQADVNLDGSITDADHLDLSKVKAYCLITNNSFSCGNLVPALFKQSGLVTLLGQQSGGGACVVEQTIAADGTVYQYSSRYRLSTVKNGSYYSIDQGVAPDFSISKPERLYDRVWLTNYINQLP